MRTVLVAAISVLIALPASAHRLDEYLQGTIISVEKNRLHAEMTLTPGVAATLRKPPHPPTGPAGSGPLVSFARSGLNVRWGPPFQSLLELAEACDVPVRWSCRTGVCHRCEAALVAGAVGYQPDPVDPPAADNVLICCSQPAADIVIDL